MHASVATKPTSRSADNELFDQGCDLVAAASAIRQAAGAPEAARAVPAVLGCIESALQELMWAAAALEQTTADLVEQDADDAHCATHAPRIRESPAGAIRRRARIRRGAFARRPGPHRVRGSSVRTQAPTVHCMTFGYSAPPTSPSVDVGGGAWPTK
jgi:hypothetical protein